MRMNAAAAAPRAAPPVAQLVHAALARVRDTGRSRAKCAPSAQRGHAHTAAPTRTQPPQPSPRACPHAATPSARRFAHRVLPIQAVCFAGLPEILKAAEPLLAAAFPTDADATPLKYAVVFESRACDGLKLDRMAVINALAQCVPQPHSVDLNNPERVIMVQIVKSAAALAVLTDYYALCKYNLRCGAASGARLARILRWADVAAIGR
jgi:tRNA acetyltransferase TAN1